MILDPPWLAPLRGRIKGSATTVKGGHESAPDFLEYDEKCRLSALPNTGDEAESDFLGIFPVSFQIFVQFLFLPRDAQDENR